MKYEKPVVELMSFKENEDVMVSAVSFGLEVDTGWFVPIQ